VNSFFGLSRQDLLPLIERPVRAARVFRAVYREGVTQFREIDSIPAFCQSKLEACLATGLPAIHKRFDSNDGTRRYLLRLHDGELVESVLIPADDRITFCISSQIGCALGCTFCLTAQLGLIRDLSAGEIVSQVLVLRNDAGIDASHTRFNIVLMGMGEPLHNYDNVLRAIQILSDAHGLGLPITRITLSTSGIIPGIQRLAAEALFPNLSISLTGVSSATRDTLMPINRKYPIEQIMDEIRKLPPARQKRVMFECVMIKGLTDSADEARQLSRYVRGMPVKVNLIPLNTAPEISYERSPTNAILNFQRILVESGTATFIRRNRGNDVSGACGQLKIRDSIAVGQPS
jgi:23S rRNA (adenine2503-C2)-methyltransferase